jgi:hypothetical protein
VEENRLAPPRSSGYDTLPSMSSFADQMGFSFRAPERRVWRVRDRVATVPVFLLPTENRYLKVKTACLVAFLKVTLEW